MATPDWEAIDSAYRAGLSCIREIASAGVAFNMFVIGS